MKRITIIGSGNIGLSLAKGLVDKAYCKAQDITLTRRNIHLLQEAADLGFEISTNNLEALASADIVVLAVLPQQLKPLMQELASAIDLQRSLVVSVVSGVSCAELRHTLGEEVKVIRAMPNTAIAIGESMTCIASDRLYPREMKTVQQLFETVGSVVEINEELMTSATALCACGIAFFLRAIRAASQGGVEIGFHAPDALKMAVQTAKGAADLLLVSQSHPEGEIDKVTSPKGCTIAGLNEMEHFGFSSAFIKAIKLSARKAGELYKD